MRVVLLFFFSFLALPDELWYHLMLAVMWFIRGYSCYAWMSAWAGLFSHRAADHMPQSHRKSRALTVWCITVGSTYATSPLNNANVDTIGRTVHTALLLSWNNAIQGGRTVRKYMYIIVRFKHPSDSSLSSATSWPPDLPPFVHIQVVSCINDQLAAACSVCK